MFDAGWDEPAEASTTALASDVSDASANGVSYHKQIRALLETHCSSCHVKGGIAPFAFEGWDSVKAVSAAIVSAVEAGIMPPTMWNGECQPIRDDPTLPQDAKTLFSAWKANGYAEGSPADYVPPPKREKLDLGSPSITMSMPMPYTPPANADEYRCFVLGKLSEDTYLTGLQILPGELSEVHHVQIHRVDETQFATVQDADDADPSPGYPCSAGTRVSSQNMFSYRPGSGPVSFDKGDAAYIAAGSHLLIQVHYNTVFLPSGTSPTPDQTKIALWTLPSGTLPQRVVYRTTVFGPVNIPAGNPETLSTVTRKMSSLSSFGGVFGVGGTFLPGEIIGMTPHAHQLATRMYASLKRADGTETCLDDVPKWNFNWQFDYIFARGVPYGPDDSLVGNCLYDNSPENQPVINGVRQPPRDVQFGERSIDEMCQHYIWLRFEREAFLAARK